MGFTFRRSASEADLANVGSLSISVISSSLFLVSAVVGRADNKCLAAGLDVDAEFLKSVPASLFDKS
jgi:hypothetical protein